MNFTFQVQSETIMAPPIPLTLADDVNLDKFIIGQLSRSKKTNRLGGKVTYRHSPENKNVLRMYMKQTLIHTVKYGMEPLNSMWTEDSDGKPVRLAERPPFDPNETHQLDLCCDYDHEMVTTINRVNARLCEMMKKEMDSEDLVPETVRQFGDEKLFASFKPTVSPWAIYREDFGAKSMSLIKNLKDYPVSKPHYLLELVLTPDYLQVLPKEDGPDVLRVFWKVFAFGLGPEKKPKEELSPEEEEARREKSLFDSFTVAYAEMPSTDMEVVEVKEEPSTPKVAGKKRSAPAQEGAHRAAKKSK